jgi:sporulation protein YlmC with PRC-barrel domain
MGIVEETAVERHMNFRPLSNAIGANVVNIKEEHLGKIEDIMFDVEKARIAYVVVSFGSWFGAGNKKMFSIPWESLKFNRGDYILNLDRSVFEKAEGLDEDVWTLNKDKLMDIYKRCGVQPYWK